MFNQERSRDLVLENFTAIESNADQAPTCIQYQPYDMILYCNLSNKTYYSHVLVSHALTGSRDFPLVKIPGFLKMNSRDLSGSACRV